jgi:TATA-binding protein-associated factor
LDEGHCIKNAESKIAQATKKIKANHRLILTGTPIQNDVLELWSLFDFLMPGFLGTAKVFQERFAKPIVAGKTAATEQEQESGWISCLLE